MLWFKTLVLLCVLLNITEGLSYYYRKRHTHRHKHLYKCGFQKCIRRKSPPVCKQWCLVFVNPGCCQQPSYTCCIFKEKPGYCPASQSCQRCVWPFPYYLTSAYQCRHDFNCPTTYKCCYDSCYVHKVCKAPVVPHTTSTNSPKETEETTLHPSTTTTEIITTSEILTTVDEKTTTAKVQTTEEEITTEERHETTISEESTTVKKQTTQEVTTTETTLPTTTIGKTTSSAKTTTVDDIEESGSGELEVPEPEVARYRLPKDVLEVFSDDEDFF